MATNRDALAERFAQLTAERDKPVSSETEAVGYNTADGSYVHEVVSRSPNRSTVTKRTTVTRSGADGGVVSPVPTAPTLQRLAVPPPSSRPTVAAPPLPPVQTLGPLNAEQPQIRSGVSAASGRVSPTNTSSSVASPTVPLRSNIGPGPAYHSDSYHQASRGYSSTSSPPPPLTTTLPQQQQQVSASAWQQRQQPSAPSIQQCPATGQYWARTTTGGTVPPYDEDSIPATPSSVKSVRIGGISNTTMVEPSRISPLKVLDVYAPVRYVSKRELRAMRAQRPVHEDDLTRHIRHSSVPRLDSLQYEAQQMHQQRHSGREFHAAAAGGTNSGNRAMSPSQPQMNNGMGRSSAPRTGSAQSRRGATNSPTATRRSSSSNNNNNRSPLPRRHYVEEDNVEEDEGDDDYDEDMAHSDLQPFTHGGPVYYHHHPPQRPSPYPYSNGAANHPITTTTTTLDQLPNTLHVFRMAELIAFSRRSTVIPEIPSMCQEAFRLLHRGTYLIKYGRQGVPHERFVAMRIVEDEARHVPQPYLVWSVHAEAASFKERLHLSFLTDVLIGTQSFGFQRHMQGPNVIAGPTVRGKRCAVPATYAFSLVFQSNTQKRSVDLLALDDQTYHAWLLVCQYFADINRGHAGETVDADTLAPDTPRSQSSGAF